MWGIPSVFGGLPTLRWIADDTNRFVCPAARGPTPAAISTWTSRIKTARSPIGNSKAILRTCSIALDGKREVTIKEAATAQTGRVRHLHRISLNGDHTRRADQVSAAPRTADGKPDLTGEWPGGSNRVGTWEDANNGTGVGG